MGRPDRRSAVVEIRVVAESAVSLKAVMFAAEARMEVVLREEESLATVRPAYFVQIVYQSRNTLRIRRQEPIAHPHARA